jgi:hypothetical protein
MAKKVETPQKFPMMDPIRYDEHFVETVKIPSDPAFREITSGLNARIIDLLRNPGQLGIDCCFEGCCVSWCCIRLT